MVACLGRFGLVYAFAFGPPFWPPLCVPVDVTRFCDGAVVLFELFVGACTHLACVCHLVACPEALMWLPAMDRFQWPLNNNHIDEASQKNGPGTQGWEPSIVQRRRGKTTGTCISARTRGIRRLHYSTNAQESTHYRARTTQPRLGTQPGKKQTSLRHANRGRAPPRCRSGHG